MLFASAVSHRVEVVCPGSGANMGLFYDCAGVAYSQPVLGLILEMTTGGSVELAPYNGCAPTPLGRIRGTAGLVALNHLLQSINLTAGLKITYHEIDALGFPSGGTGSSGAEAASAVVAANAMFNLGMTESELVLAAAKGEPGGHLDNVAPSVMGGIVFIQNDTDAVEFTKVVPPEGLGLILGLSSFPKIGGTENARLALANPLSTEIMAEQATRANIARQALLVGNVTKFLSVISTDLFHEPRRADAKVYGNYNAADLADLKQHLQSKFGIALCISGAGPNMQLWYDKQSKVVLTPEGQIQPTIGTFMREWFGHHEISIKLLPVSVSELGAHVIQTFP